MTAEERVRVEHHPERGVDHLVLARGDKGNAIDLAFGTALEQAVLEVVRHVEEGSTRLLLLIAEGPFFCVGGDLEDFPTGRERVVPHLEHMASMVHHALQLVVELPVPVVTRVQGVAAGAGVGLAVCGDVVIASRTARFRSAYTSVGLSPDCGTSWLLPRVIGERRAMDMVLTNRVVSAEEAEHWGLVSRVAEPEDLDDEVDRVVEMLLGLSTDGLVESKRLLQAAPHIALVDHLADEASTIARLAAAPAAIATRQEFLARSAGQL